MASSPDAGAVARLRAAVSARVQLVRDAIAMQRAALAARLRLIPNWRETLRHAWSIRLDVLLIVLGVLEFGVDALSGNPPIDPMRFVAIGMVIKALALGARLIKQTKVSGDEA